YGELWIRGPWIASAYFRRDDKILETDADGIQWFPTGDVCTIDEDGYMLITDRSKDVIKSGGEWMSSIALANIAMAHAAVAMAARIGVEHPQWHEGPNAAVVLRPEATPTREHILASFDDKTSTWQAPADLVSVQDNPLGPTVKKQKR